MHRAVPSCWVRAYGDSSLWGFFMGLRGPLLWGVSGADPLTGHTLRGLAVTPAVPRLPWARDTPSRLDNGAARALPRARAGGSLWRSLRPRALSPPSTSLVIPEGCWAQALGPCRRPHARSQRRSRFSILVRSNVNCGEDVGPPQAHISLRRICRRLHCDFSFVKDKKCNFHPSRKG